METNQYNGIFYQLDLMLSALSTKCTEEQADIIMDFVKGNLPMDYWGGVAEQLDYICPNADYYYQIAVNLSERGFH